MNASTSPPPVSDRTLHGILLTCAAVFLFASHGGSSKFLSGFHLIVMVVRARYPVHTLLMVAVLVPCNGLAVIRSRRLLIQSARVLCLIGASLLFTTSLRYLPLAEVTAVNFLAPLLVTALPVPLSREKVSLDQWLAVSIGLVGVFFIMRPGGTLFTPAALLPLGSALCFGLYQLLTRMLTNSNSPTTSNFLAGIFNTLITSPLVPFFWQTPSPLHGPMMIAPGSCGMGDYLLLTQAFRHAPLATLTPFSYGQIIFTGLPGLLMFGHVPDVWALLGILVICASDLVVAWRRGH